MAFRASNILPVKGYEQAKANAWHLKARADYYIATAANGNIGYDFLAELRGDLSRALASLEQASTIAGIVAYAQDQENDPGYDVAAEFTDMTTKIATAITWVDVNTPTNVTALTPDQWSGISTMISTTFTPAQTAQLRVELQAVSDAVV